MGARNRGHSLSLLFVILCLAAAAPIAEAQQSGRRQAVGRADRSGAYDDGYRDGLQRGAQDARARRLFSSSSYTGANTDYRRGFAEGYRVGYDREHAAAPMRRPDDGRAYQQLPPRSAGRGYREPAFATGFDSGYDKGREDGRDGDRYDPVRHRDYRDADRGYRDGYGSRDAYRNNFRAGFRQGYEEGYRAGARNRR